MVTSMTAALKVQVRVIYALMMREVYAVYGRSRLGYLWALFDSIIGIMVFYGIRTVGGFTPPHGMPLIFFLLAGFFPFNTFRGTVTKCMGAVGANRALLTFPQITPIDLMIARMVVLWGKEITVAILLAYVFFFWGDTFQIIDFPLLAYSIIAPSLLGLGVGMIVHALNVMFPVTEKIVPLILRVMFFSSGVFFSLSRLPSFVINYLWWNPMTQIIEMCRMSIAEGYRGMECSVPYVTAVLICSLCLGLLLERYVRRKLQ